jgi:NADH oxidase (H2O2-forming)
VLESDSTRARHQCESGLPRQRERTSFHEREPARGERESMERRIIVVGAGSAGASACFAARKQDRKAEIICINKEPHPTYSRCALPFVIGGEIDSFDTPTVFGFDFYRSQKVEIIPGVEVESIDTAAKRVKTSEGGFDYTALILATGGTARVPEMPGAQLDGVFVLRTRDDGAAIMARAKAGSNALINGASFIALEAAEALKRRGMKVTCVIRSRALRSMVDQQFSRIVEDKLAEKGIEVLKGSALCAVTGEGGVSGAVAGESEIPTDMVIMCTGTAPEVGLARRSGLAIGQTGGIEVNERMETSAAGVYAAGDCVESRCFIRGVPMLSGLGTIATRQGMTAGANAAGGEATAPPVLGASVMKLFDVEIGAVGLTEDSAKDAGIEAVAAGLKYPTLPHYYPGGSEAHVRLIALKDTGVIIGGQVMVSRGAAERVNMLSAAILKGITASELHMADFCYSPPCSDIWAAEAIAAGGLERRLGKTPDMRR